MKNCSNNNCNQVNPQPFSEFFKRNSSSLRTQCKSCDKYTRKIRYDVNPKLYKEKNAINTREYRKANPDKCLMQERSRRKKSPEQYLLKAARDRANKKNLPFNLSIDDILIPKFCPYFGVSLFVGKKSDKSQSPSIDRLIPELGYIKGNIEVISYRANVIKNDGTAEEHLKISQRMIKLGIK